MSRLLKQVYSQNVYVQFRFQSSLRKYDKKPTKKIKCEAFCKHCINHHKKIEYSPLKQMRPNIEYRSKFKKSNMGSIERPQQKSIISSCKSIKLSKRKQQVQNDQNLLEVKMYRGLLQEQHKEGNKIQKSQEENSSSMQQEIFFNQFGNQPSQESNKDCMDKDFDRIQITNRSQLTEKHSQQIKATELTSVSKSQQMKQFKNQLIQEQEIPRYKQQELSPQPSQARLQLIQVICQQPIIEQINHQHLMQRQEQMKLEQIIGNKKVQDFSQEIIVPNQTTSLNRDIIQQTEQSKLSVNSPKQMIEQSKMADSMMDKCLLFQGGRIYVDTSGQNFYISVRVFNKLIRKYQNTQELTKILIQHRPCLQQKKEQIKNQLEEYLSSLI